MSDAATSFCRSTNCFGPRSMPRGDGTTHSGASGSSAASSTVGVHAAWRALEPARRAASVPAATPSVRHACSAKLPLAAPAERSACTGVARHEARLDGIEARAAARLRMQVHNRAPAAGHRHEVARQRAHRPGGNAALGVERHDVHGANALRAARIDDDRVGDHLDARLAHALGQLALRRAARVDDRRHRDARGGEAERGAIRAVVVGEHDGAPPGRARHSG